MSNPLNAKINDFRKSYIQHYRAYKETDMMNSPDTRRLVLVYAVECGLKYWVMRKYNLRDFESLKEFKKGIYSTHDIKELSKEVEIESKFPLKNIRLQKGGVVEAKRYHEMWRYGIQPEDESQVTDAEKMLRGMAEWLIKHTEGALR